MPDYTDKQIATYLVSIGFDVDEAQVDKEMKAIHLKMQAYEEQSNKLSKQAAEARSKFQMNEYQDLINRKKLIDAKYFAEQAKLERRFEAEKKAIRLAEERATNKIIAAERTAARARERAAAQKERNSYLSKQKGQLASFFRYTVGSFAITAVVGALTTLTKSLLQVQLELSRVSALTGATNEEMKAIEATVYQVAIDFNIAATNVAKFAVEMAKLGQSAENIAKLGNEAAILSSILGTDMADAGKLLVTTMNQYNIGVDQAERVTSVFIQTMAESPLVVDELRTALQYVGTAANAARIEIEDITKIMALLSNRGLRASKIGTGLRNVILNLSSSGETFYETMVRMSEEGLTLTEALEEFGKRGATAAYILVNEWEEVSEQFDRGVPTGIENTSRAIESLTNEMTTFGRVWEKVKAGWSFLWTGESIERDATNKFLIEFSDNLSASGESLAAFAIGARAAVDSLPDDSSISELYSFAVRESGTFVGSGPLADEIENQQKQFILMLKEQVATQKEQRRLIDEVNKAGKDLVDDVVEGQLDRDSALNILADDVLREDLYNRIETTLPDKTVYAIIDAAIKQTTTDIRTLDTRTLPELIARRDSLLDSMKEIASQTNVTVLDLEKYIRFEDDKDAVQELICKMRAMIGLEPTEECEKTKAGRAKRLQIEDTTAEFKLMREVFETEHVQALALIDTMTNMVRDQKMSLDKYFDELSTLIDAGALSPEDARAFLDTRYDEIIKMLRDKSAERIEEIQVASRMQIGTYDDQISNAKEQIEFLSGLPPSEDRDKLIKQLEDDIIKYYADIENVKQKAIKATEREDNARESAEDSLKKKKITLVEDLFGTTEENEFDLNNLLRMIDEGLRLLADIYNQYADERHEQQMADLEAERELLERRNAQAQEYLDAQFDNAVLSQEQYNEETERLRRKAIDDENKVAKAEFEAQKKRDAEQMLIDAITGSSQAFIQGVATYPAPAGPIIGAAMAALVWVQAAIGLSAIKNRKFIPKKYEEGGLVEGPSHSEGGVPFTVKGKSGYEMEGGEYIFSKADTQRYLPMFEALRGNKKHDMNYFQDGGRVSRAASADSKNLAEELKNTIIRAYITDKDLKQNDERTEKMRQRTDVW